MRAIHPAPNTARSANTGRSPNTVFELLVPVEPLLTSRIASCRHHCTRVRAIHEAIQDPSPELNRLLHRTAARAIRCLRSAEASLTLLQALAIRDK